MKQRTLIVALALIASLCSCASTQEGGGDLADTSTGHEMPSMEDMAAAMESLGRVSDEHRWLQQLVGEWTSTMTMDGPPGQPPMTMESTEKITALGELWIVSEAHGDSPLGPMQSRMTLGYDPQDQRFTGTWVDSMTSHMWVYDGTLDASKKVLTLSAEGPDFQNPGKTGKYRDVITLESPDQKVLTSWIQGADGEWTSFMTINYSRKK